MTHHRVAALAHDYRVDELLAAAACRAATELLARTGGTITADLVHEHADRFRLLLLDALYPALGPCAPARVPPAAANKGAGGQILWPKASTIGSVLHLQCEEKWEGVFKTCKVAHSARVLSRQGIFPSARKRFGASLYGIAATAQNVGFCLNAR
jgi:hypothetical protein